MPRSDLDGERDPSFEIAFHGEEHPSVSVESVTRHYEAARYGLVYKLFAPFGGVAKEGIPFIEEDDEDDDEALFDDEDMDIEERLGQTTRALDSVSLRVSGPGCLAIVGPSGSGKSVLLRTITGIAPPTSGRIEVRGWVTPIFGVLAKHIPKDGKVKRVLPAFAMLTRMPVAQVRRRLPQIFALYGDPEIGRRSIRVVPPKKRINLVIAMALGLDSDILIIDAELPTGDFGERCRERLTELKRSGTLILIASQDLESVAWLADHVVFLDKGRIVGDTTVEEAYEAERERLAVEAEAAAEAAREASMAARLARIRAAEEASQRQPTG